VVLVVGLVLALARVLDHGLLLSWLLQQDVTVVGSHVLEHEVEVLLDSSAVIQGMNPHAFVVWVVEGLRQSRCSPLPRPHPTRLCCFQGVIARRLVGAHAPLLENDVWGADNRHSS
jgi:hypothetical protein